MEKTIENPKNIRLGQGEGEALKKKHSKIPVDEQLKMIWDELIEIIERLHRLERKK